MTKKEFLHYTKTLRRDLVDLARRRGVSDPDAVVQDVFLSIAANRLYVNVSVVEDEARAYIFSAVSKRCFSAYRISAKRAVAAPMLDLADVAERETTDPYPVLDAQIAVRHALDSLEDQTTAEGLRLVYMHDYTLAEAAEILGVKLPTLYKRVCAAFPVLREKLADFAPDFNRVAPSKKIA